MSRHQADRSVIFRAQDYDLLPERRKLEDPSAELDIIPAENPPQREANREPYRFAPELEEVVNLCIALGRPLLLQGDPGCGKTRLAHAVAYALGYPLEEAYVKSTSRAQDLLYRYDAVTRLYDAQLGEAGPRGVDGGLRYRTPSAYVRLGPLGRAIARAGYGRRSVVLIDEIDKADLDFPNDLLWELDRLEFRVEEAPEMHFRAGEDPALRPIVFVTHNEEKALPPAFLRRCVYHWMEFPSEVRQLEAIVAYHHPEADELGQRAAGVVLRLRELDLTKKPGLSELLDWVGFLAAARAKPDEVEQLRDLGALVKHQPDRQRARSEFGLA